MIQTQIIQRAVAKKLSCQCAKSGTVKCLVRAIFRIGTLWYSTPSCLFKSVSRGVTSFRRSISLHYICIQYHAICSASATLPVTCLTRMMTTRRGRARTQLSSPSVSSSGICGKPLRRYACNHAQYHSIGVYRATPPHSCQKKVASATHSCGHRFRAPRGL